MPVGSLMALATMASKSCENSSYSDFFDVYQLCSTLFCNVIVQCSFLLCLKLCERIFVSLKQCFFKTLSCPMETLGTVFTQPAGSVWIFDRQRFRFEDHLSCVNSLFIYVCEWWNSAPGIVNSRSINHSNCFLMFLWHFDVSTLQNSLGIICCQGILRPFIDKTKLCFWAEHASWLRPVCPGKLSPS